MRVFTHLEHEGEGIIYMKHEEKSLHTRPHARTHAHTHTHTHTHKCLNTGVVCHEGGRHQDDPSSGLSFIRVVLSKVLFHQGELG